MVLLLAQYVGQGRVYSSPGLDPGTQTANSFPPLTPAQELFALVLHLTSSDMNGLPPLDPNLPLNPDFVLDTALPTSLKERQAALKELEEECWDAWPVVILGRQNEVFTAEAISLLKSESYLGAKAHGMGIVYLDRRRESFVFAHGHNWAQESDGSFLFPPFLLFFSRHGHPVFPAQPIDASTDFTIHSDRRPCHWNVQRAQVPSRPGPAGSSFSARGCTDR